MPATEFTRCHTPEGRQFNVEASPQYRRKGQRIVWLYAMPQSRGKCRVAADAMYSSVTGNSVR
jgi:hypothetical protein